jgi:hypothetical protein
MRPLVCVLVPIFLAGCAQARSVSTVTPLAANTVASCDTSAGPLLYIDGVAVQPSCDASKKEPAPKCDPNGPLIFVDGVMICDKP